MPNYVFFCPNAVDGGTALLLARFAQYLVQAGFPIRVVDYQDGCIARHLRARDLPFEHTLPNPTAEPFADDEIVVMILLHAKYLAGHFRPSPGTRFLFWSTHPHDGMKLLPAFNVFLERTNRQRRVAMRLLHPRYHARVARFLDRASELGGLAHMDGLNWETNRDVFGLKQPPVFLPVMTEPAAKVASWSADAIGTRVFWVGRLAHFKTRPVEALIRAIDLHNRRGGPPLTLDLIGGGEDEARVRRLAEDVSIVARFHGTLPIAEIEPRLLAGADLVVGHGMSLLEGARLGIPCLLLDGWTIDLDDALVGLRWLHDEGPGEIGRLIEAPAQVRGVPFEEALSAWQQPGAVSRLGAATYAHWRDGFSQDAVGRAAKALLDRNTFTWARIQEIGFDRLDLPGRALQAMKARYHARKGA